MIETSYGNIGQDYSTFIIAEAGVNHNGNLDLAKKLIDAAVEAGTDAVKFQTFTADKLVTMDAAKAKYQEEVTDKQESQYQMLKKLELTEKEHVILKDYCAEKDIIFMSTPFDFESVDLLEKIGIEMYKVGSGDLINLPLLEYIAKKDKPIILSTGMSNLSEVEEAVETICQTGNKKLALLHCVSNYPAKYEDVNLKAMDTMKQAFKLPVGYSDHTLGIEVPIAAVARGAVVIEKHFTLDKSMNGPDHKASLNPKELARLVEAIKNIESGLGDGIKRCQELEKNIRRIARKSIVTIKNIKAGERLSKDKIEIKRPGIGIKPKYYNLVLKSRAISDIKEDELITWEDIEIE